MREKCGNSGDLLVAQTTIKEETFDGVARALKKRAWMWSARNTICNATSKRQEECAELARTAI